MPPTDRELFEKALKALEYAAERIGCPDDDDAIGVARKALRERLAQSEQEPVAYQVWGRMGGISFRRDKPDPNEYVEWDALYITPPRREWVGLTDEEIMSLVPVTGHRPATTFARSIEAALREKNT